MMYINVSLVVLVILLGIVPISGACVTTDSKCRLLESLLGSYEKFSLPDCGGEEAIGVKIDLSLRQVVDLVETEQVLGTNVWVRLTWKDCRMTWNASEYPGVNIIDLPIDQIWTPDVTLYDDTKFGSNTAMSERKYFKVTITSDGTSSQHFPTVLSSICTVDATYFPFDHQNCDLKFGLWVYDDSQVSLTSNGDGDISSYVENAEWRLEGVNAHQITINLNSRNFTTVVYRVIIHRRPAFFMITLFFPCLLISTMAVIGYFLPPSSSQKLGLQMTLLLSLTVFEFLTISLIPPNSKPLPLMCVYFAIVMLLASMSCLLSVVVLKLHLKGEQGWKVSPRLRHLLIDRLGKLLRMKRPHIMRDHVEKDLKEDGNGGIENRGFERQSVLSNIDDETTSTELGAVLKCFKKISIRLEYLLRHIEDEKKEHESVEFQDWVTIASIMDRLFLGLYILISVIVFLIFLIKLAS